MKLRQFEMRSLMHLFLREKHEPDAAVASSLRHVARVNTIGKSVLRTRNRAVSGHADLVWKKTRR